MLQLRLVERIIPTPFIDTTLANSAIENSQTYEIFKNPSARGLTTKFNELICKLHLWERTTRLTLFEASYFVRRNINPPQRWKWAKQGPNISDFIYGKV